MPTTDYHIMEKLLPLLNLISPFVAGTALLAFFAGVLGYVFSAGDEAARGTAKSLVLWGFIIAFLMMAIRQFASLAVNGA